LRLWDQSIKFGSIDPFSPTLRLRMVYRGRNPPATLSSHRRFRRRPTEQDDEVRVLVVDLYSDHLMAPEPNHRVRPPYEIWYATQQHPRLYARAAKAIGLSDAEYQEFRRMLLGGSTVRVALPKRLDAMSGVHRGYVYAVHNAIIRATRDGWPAGYRVRLADGAEVYVPDLCGNISVRRPPRVAYVPPLARTHAHYTMAVATAPIDRAVSVSAPDVPEAPVIAEAVPARVAPTCAWWCFALPVLAVIPAIIHGGQSTPAPVPPCSAGSNAAFACEK
jgi:hypothetical protein